MLSYLIKKLQFLIFPGQKSDEFVQKKMPENIKLGEKHFFTTSFCEELYFLKGVFSNSSGNHKVTLIFCSWRPQIFTIDPVFTKGFEFELKLN